MKLSVAHFLNRLLVALALTTLTGCPLKGQAQAQTQGKVASAVAQAVQAPLLTDSEVRAKYQNCPGGWYSGPRPGKARFAKDPWLWVVTPEFAQRFCMPPEFVSQDLKGAEAVAFRLLKKTDEENCGFGGIPNACAGELVLRFEVYVKAEAKLPKWHEGRYYQVARLPSRQLITRAEREWKVMEEMVKRVPEPALKPHFFGQQVGLSGVRNGKVIWPIVALFEETHFGGIFEGIDYYAFEGSSGFFENPGIEQKKIKQFVLDFRKLNWDKSKPLINQPLTDMAYVIDLPDAFTAQIAEIDRTRGRNVRAQLNDAFGRPAKAAASAAKAAP